MRISSFKLPVNSDNNGITIGKRLNGELSNLSNIVVLTGANGSGKSRLLKIMYNTFDSFKNNSDYKESCFKIIKKDEDSQSEEEIELTKELAKNFNFINYSHFDAKLQVSERFSPYVIHQAKNKLKKCNYEETALNSLLYLKDLAEGYSEESNESNDYKGLMEFIEFAKELELDFSWNKNEKSLKIFNRELKNAKLSPGQLYALRIAVACKSHKIDENFAFLLDEPETHLHPSLLIKIITNFTEHFKNAQFFIATHSLPLISYLTVTRDDTTVFFMDKGEVKDRLRSNSQPILNNLIGSEDKLFAIKQLFVSSEEMACNKFCMECFLKPAVIRGGSAKDPSVSMVEDNINISSESSPIIIVDYGAGEGRLLQCMIEDGFKNGYEYNPYNIDQDDAKYCEQLISTAKIKGKSYFRKENLAELYGKADRVLMVNVLHEISPELWKEEFDTVSKLLKEDGKLIIVEREILTMGESPFINGYLMLTGIDNSSPAADILFGKENVVFSRHKEKPHIISYTIGKEGVEAVQKANLKDVLLELKKIALEQIKSLKKDMEKPLKHIDKYKNGIRLSFWLNQLSCAIISVDET